LKYFTVAELEESVIGAGFQIVQKDIMGDNPVSYFIAAKRGKEISPAFQFPEFRQLITAPILF